MHPPAEAYAWGLIEEGYVWLLLRAVYGLNDGPLEWVLECHLVLIQEGFVQLRSASVCLGCERLEGCPHAIDAYDA